MCICKNLYLDKDFRELDLKDSLKSININRIRLAHKSSSEFLCFFFLEARFRKRETPKNRARGSGSSTCFSCRKPHQVTSFWRELFLVPCQSCLVGRSVKHLSLSSFPSRVVFSRRQPLVTSSFLTSPDCFDKQLAQQGQIHPYVCPF